MYWADKIQHLKKQIESLNYHRNSLDYDTLIGLNTELRKLIQPIESISTFARRLQGMNSVQSHFLRSPKDDYKIQRFNLTKQQTLEIIANIELLLNQLTEGQYSEKS